MDVPLRISADILLWLKSLELWRFVNLGCGILPHEGMPRVGIRITALSRQRVVSVLTRAHVLKQIITAHGAQWPFPNETAGKSTPAFVLVRTTLAVVALSRIRIIRAIVKTGLSIFEDGWWSLAAIFAISSGAKLIAPNICSSEAKSIAGWRVTDICANQRTVEQSRLAILTHTSQGVEISLC